MAARTAISAVVNDRYTIQCARRSAPSTASFIDSSSFSFSSLVSSSSSGIYVSRITNCIWNATMGETQRQRFTLSPGEGAEGLPGEVNVYGIFGYAIVGVSSNVLVT